MRGCDPTKTRSGRSTEKRPDLADVRTLKLGFQVGSSIFVHNSCHPVSSKTVGTVMKLLDHIDPDFQKTVDGVSKTVPEVVDVVATVLMDNDETIEIKLLDPTDRFWSFYTEDLPRFCTRSLKARHRARPFAVPCMHSRVGR